jgi:hypothetical protein
MKVNVATACTFLALGFGSAQAQQSQPQFTDMSFFITSEPGPSGANFGGIEGADKHCENLAAKAGAGNKIWRAYLSQQAIDGKPAIHARDRIGKGPWRNVLGTRIAASVDDLHDGYKVNINTDTALTETGKKVMSREFTVNQHDILTGTQANGTAPPAGSDLTCGNWTKGGEDGAAMVGHHDRMGLRDDAPSRSWNAAHPSRGCSNARLRLSGGNGLLYCFAVD